MTLVRKTIAAAIVLLAARADAGMYPTNLCVSSKQKAVGKYCANVLKAWATWEHDQDSARRDDEIADQAVRLAFTWGKAEGKASTSNIDCVDTTMSRPDAIAAVDGGVAGIVSAINSGLNLLDPDHARCGQKLLRAAATKCGKILLAQSRHVKKLERDPLRSQLASARISASARFALSWAAATVANCPTNADQSTAEAQVDAIVDGIAFNTTNSPSVPDTQFATYTPTGPIHYQNADLNPTCMDGSPYAYFAKRGTVNKLVIYYQGGGACWEHLTCSLPACDTNVVTDQNASGTDNPNAFNVGFGDLSNPDNPFKDWSIVFVSYCTCDIHFGDSAQDYPPHVEHRGYQNSRVVEKWTREHFVDPEEIFVTGSSAGAYGAWFNAPLHEDIWPASQFEVLADAGNGVITQSFYQNYFPNWNFAAHTPTNIPGVQAALATGSIPDYTEAVADFFPRTRWAHYSSAYDGGFGGQSSFYNIMLNGNNPASALFWWQASCAYNTAMRSQAIATAAAVPSNYRYYIGTGSRHTMWGSNKVYNDTTGGVPTIVDWINSMLAGDSGWTNVECTNCGLTILDDPIPNPLQSPFEQQGPDVVVNCNPTTTSTTTTTTSSTTSTT